MKQLINRVFICLMLISLSGFSQQFTETNIVLAPMRYAILAWGDYDNDGDLDILAAGAKYVGQPFQNSIPSVIVYRNDGNDNFIDIQAPINGIQQGSAAWGDYDNDGDLDILINGRTENGTLAQIYRNDGGDTFGLAADLGALDYPYADWGDVNNDGYLDLIVTGDVENGITTWDPIAVLYENDQNGGFTPSQVTVPGVGFGAVQFADYDNDQDLDLVVSGVGEQDIFTTIYENDNGVFSDVNPGFIGLANSKAAWGDYDNDGDFDVVIGGAEGGISATRAQMYRNNGGIFSPIEFAGDTLPDLGLPSFDWGDFDNDGDLDLLTTGQIGILATRYSAIFQNDGNDTFTALTQDIVSVRTGDATWGDYDNDGDLDILICGTDTTDGFGEYVTKIYRNELNAANAAPTAPAGLSASIRGSQVVLSWQPSQDDHTPQQALSYNLRIGTAPGASDIMNPMSAESNGYRKLPAMGNANLNTSWEIGPLADGQYYWRVQAIDGAMNGSVFSTEATFYVGATGLNENEMKIPAAFRLHTNYPNPFNPETSIRYDIAEKSTVTLTVFNANGEKIRTLVNEIKASGSYEATWNGKYTSGQAAASGIYFYRLTTDGFSQVRQMLLVR